MINEQVNEYDVFELTREVNPVLRKGMQGTILMVLDFDNFLVEFVDNDGFNYVFEDEAVFTLNKSDFKIIIKYKG